MQIQDTTKGGIVIIIPITHPEIISLASTFFKQGAIIVFPTDTSYGIGTVGTKSNEENIRKIFTIKSRSYDKPLSLLISKDMVSMFLEIPTQLQKSLEKIWPERLTVIAKCTPYGVNTLSPLLNQNSPEKIAFRVPRHNTLLNIIERVGNPIIGTSANKSGNPSRYELHPILKEFSNENIDLFIDGGKLMENPPSTIVDITNPNEPVLLREGQVEIEKIFKNAKL